MNYSSVCYIEYEAHQDEYERIYWCVEDAPSYYGMVTEMSKFCLRHPERTDIVVESAYPEQRGRFSIHGLDMLERDIVKFNERVPYAR